MQKKILIFGTSISCGAWDSEGGWVSRLRKVVNQKVVESDLEYSCMLYNQSISGDTSTDILNRLESEISGRLSDEPEERTIILELGINDSLYTYKKKEFQVPIVQYQSNISKIAEISKKHAKNIVCIGAPPVIDTILDPIPWHTEGAYKTKYSQEFNKILGEECKQKEISYLDIFSVFESGNIQELMSVDGVHPSSIGHKAYFELIKEGLTNLDIFS